jgi:hypothetical protein
VGWVATDEHTAVREPRHPERGELREFLVGGATGDPDELEFILRGAGLSPSSITLLESGSVELVFEDRLGRARFRADPDQPAWLVLFMGEGSAADLDADAILMSLLPVPVAIGIFLEPPTPLAAGFDGDPWGAAPDPVTTSDSGWWSTGDSSIVWGQDLTIVGPWEGTAMVRGDPMRLKLRLEGDGVVVVETRRGEIITVLEGSWTSRKGEIRLDLGEGNIETSNYEVLGTTLTLRYQGVAYDLVQR